MRGREPTPGALSRPGSLERLPGSESLDQGPPSAGRPWAAPASLDSSVRGHSPCLSRAARRECPQPTLRAPGPRTVRGGSCFAHSFPTPGHPAAGGPPTDAAWHTGAGGPCRRAAWLRSLRALSGILRLRASKGPAQLLLLPTCSAAPRMLGAGGGPQTILPY